MMNERDGTLVNPDNPGIKEMAEAVTPVLRKYSKTAPVNEELLDFHPAKFPKHLSGDCGSVENQWG